MNANHTVTVCCTSQHHSQIPVQEWEIFKRFSIEIAVYLANHHKTKTKTTIAPLQRAQNVAARLVARLGPRDHVSNALDDLHWLPVQHRITYKFCLLMHLVHNNRAPSYLVDSVTATASLSHRGRPQSASSQRYEQPRTRLKFGWRCFAFAGPAARNSLPSSVQELTDTTAFKHQLKTLLFPRCYSSSRERELYSQLHCRHTRRAISPSKPVPIY